MYAQSVGQKVMQLTLVGTGEPLLRMQKRLGCAAAELGITLQLGIEKNPEAWSLTHDKTPAVLAQGTLLMTGLMRTEDIVQVLRERLALGPLGNGGETQ
jgi:hypothetical protein